MKQTETSGASEVRSKAVKLFEIFVLKSRPN